MPSEPNRLFPPFRLDPTDAQLWRDNERINLRRKTFEVLRYLLDHPGQLVTKATLLDAVWSEVSVSDSMPATCVTEIRRALGDDAKTPRFIETVHRRGYRFVANVTTAAVPEGAPSPRRVMSGPKPIVVGREAELAQLQSRFAEVLEGQRRVIFVAGEAGIGKTAFVQEFLDAISQDTVPQVGRGQCLEQYGAGEPYMPVLEALSRLSKEHGNDSVTELLSRLAPIWLAQMPELLTREDRLRLQNEAQGVTQQRMLREMTHALEALAAQSPLVLLLEDLHWCDFSTLELISAIARRRESSRLMVLGTYRPVEVLENDHPLRRMKRELELHHDCEEFRLKLLNEDNVEDYLSRRFSADGPRKFETLAPIVHARTDGNPLFMVNVVDYLIGKAGLVMPSPGVRELETIIVDNFDPPRSIREMIEHNLERLKPEEQTILEGASVAGPEFSAASVAAALERPQDEIEASCARLSRREQFVSAQGPIKWPDGTIAEGFRFHHALYQEVLYGRVPVGHQIQLHRRIAEREELGYHGHAGEVASELAYHYSRANNRDKAIEYFRLAGDRAAARGAFTEAERAYRQSLTMLNLLPLSTERDTRELELVSALLQVLYLTKGYTAPEFVGVTERANALAEKSGNIAEVVRQGFSTWTAVFVWGEHRSALALADRLLDLGRRDESSTTLGFAHSARLQVCFNLGDLVGAEQHCGHLTGFLEAPALRQFAGAIEFTLGFASLGAWMLGQPDSARERIAQLIAIARDSKNPYDLASGLVMESWLYRFLREPQPAEAAAKRALAISEERGFSFCRDFARIFIGSVRAQLGGADEGIALIRQGMAGLSEAGVRVTITDVLTRLAEAQSLGGKIDDALTTIEDALQANAEEIVFRPNILRCRGELRRKVGQNELAETDFREAIMLARGNGAKALELRAATSLAHLLDDQGKRDEASKVLAEIYNWFSQGFDTADLKDARVLLDRLSDGTVHPPRSGRGSTPKPRSKR